MRLPRAGATSVVVLAAVGAVAALWLFGGEGDQPTVSGRLLVANAGFPAAMVALDDGGLLYGERLTGRIREVDAAGRLRRRVVASVEVSTEGQRGLLGLAVDDDGSVFASWSRPDGRLVVGRVRPPPVRLVWLGPATEDIANGGHLVFAPEGGLVIGVGNLGDSELATDPDAPNGKILALDPSGPPNQMPEVLSAGWNNPYAFTYTPAEELWVADNAPGSQPERIARGDVRAPVVTELDEEIAPSGLAATGDNRLLMCGFVSRTLQAYEIGADGRPAAAGDPLATDCSIGVVLLADGRVAYARQDAIRVLPPP